MGNGSQQRLINQMFNHNELTIRQMIDVLGITDQSVRYNLKKLESLGVFERVSEKQRDPNAIYRFRHG